MQKILITYSKNLFFNSDNWCRPGFGSLIVINNRLHLQNWTDTDHLTVIKILNDD